MRNGWGLNAEWNGYGVKMRNGTDYGVKMRNGTDFGLKRGTERIWDKMRHFKLYQKF